ncbi:MAG: peptidoglycan DD-metalloendopeptidase family protein [Limimaricola sp.]|uniref:M23 family metallopeptidase n=1 Tax=Limimaricola sp. TaxID=2211665 RepID=UPI001D23A584|nr:M23 family metallopeptidase [Limimaricola sp.]MBI1418402.1 peptidoglycan DD-metalloendopeptidase family protein [Limimaricola sp.]
METGRVRIGTLQRLHTVLERRFPEKRLFLRSDTETRFIRLKPLTQLTIWGGGALVIGWTIIATAILLMDSIGAGNFRAQAQRDQAIYENRLNALSDERDARAAEAAAAQARFSSALAQVSVMQSQLLASEDRRREMETGLEVIQATLRRTMQEREAARAQVAALTAAASGTAPADAGPSPEQLSATLTMVTSALSDTAASRDKIAQDAQAAIDHSAEMDTEIRDMEARNDQIFRQIEDALTVSVAPLDKVFRDVGMDPDKVLAQVRAGYSGTGGPLTPLQTSTMGGPPDPDTARANEILGTLQRINYYRIAADKAPLAMPVHAHVVYSSPFGMRWGRMHEGQDLAAPIGTPVYATADGVVVYAGWESGYGRLIRIRHDFGIETRYGHLNAIRVTVGQRVSQGDRIGDMGNSGRSTGPHLHYEIRVNGHPVNPVTFMRAGSNVF